MAITVAQLLVRLNADTTGMEAGFARASQMLGPAGPLGVPLLLTTAAVAGIGIASLKMAGDFQKGITTLVTGAGESRANIKLVSDGILQLARDTGTSTKQLTDGMFMIESAGFHGANGLAVLRTAAEGAKVGNADLGTTADALTTIMNDYHLKTSDASTAMNILIATVANGKTHMEDLAGSISHVLPVAAAYHLKLTDVSAALATMTASGVPAADAATYLRQTIIGLGSPTSAAAAALRSVGLTTDQVNAMMKKDLPGTLKMITEAIGKKFPEGSVQYNEALRAISGGSKQMQGMLDLTGAHLNTFIGDAKGIGGVAKEGGKSIAGWSDVQKTMNFQFDRAKEVVVTLMIQLGEKLLPVATKLFAFIADNAIPALQHFVTWVSGSSASATAFKIVMIAVAGMIAAVLVTAFVSWAIAAGAAAIATIAATWPILLIGAAIALLIAGIILVVHHFGTWQNALGALGQAFGNLFGAIGQFFGGVFGAIGGFVGNILGAMGRFFSAIGLLIHNILGAIGDLAHKAWDLYTWPYRMLWDFIIHTAVPFIGNAIHGLVQIAQNVGNGIRNAIKNGINLVIGDIDSFISFLDRIQIHIPSLSVGPIHTPAFDWGGLHIPQIPKLAQGGDVADMGAFIVGDKGPELLSGLAGARVTPLASHGAASAAASGASSANGAPMTLMLQVDGRTLAQIVTKYQPGVIRQATGVRAF